jgi:membrane protein
MDSPKKSRKNIFWLLKETYRQFAQDDTWTLGAALSYYTVFSLAPILIIVIAVAGMVFGHEAVQGEVYGQVRQFLGPEGASQVEELIKNAYKPGESTVATWIAAGLLIFGATTVFYQLQQALDRIWEVKPKPTKGFKSFVVYMRHRVLSFSLVLGIGFVLLVSLVINAALVGLSNYLKARFPDVTVVFFNTLEVIFSFGVITTLFALIYRFLPDARVRWRFVWIGATFTSVLFIVGRFLIAFYLGKSNVGSTYGAAGSIVLVLLWVNYSSQILFFGAEFTQVYAGTKGYIIKPNSYAVRVAKVEVEQGPAEGVRTFEKKVEEVAEIAQPAEVKASSIRPEVDPEEGKKEDLVDKAKEEEKG